MAANTIIVIAEIHSSSSAKRNPVNPEISPAIVSIFGSNQLRDALRNLRFSGDSLGWSGLSAVMPLPSDVNVWTLLLAIGPTLFRQQSTSVLHAPAVQPMQAAKHPHGCQT